MAGFRSWSHRDLGIIKMEKSGKRQGRWRVKRDSESIFFFIEPPPGECIDV